MKHRIEIICYNPPEVYRQILLDEVIKIEDYDKSKHEGFIYSFPDGFLKKWQPEKPMLGVYIWQYCVPETEDERSLFGSKSTNT